VESVHATLLQRDETNVARAADANGASPAAVAGAEYAELKRRVKEAGLFRKQPLFYAGTITLTLALLAASLTVLALVDNLWLQLLNAALLSAVFAQLAFLGHDAGHRQIFGQARRNDLIGLMVNLLVGVSRTWWVNKHNRHHSFPNMLDVDPDIDIPALAFSDEQVQQRRGLYRVIVRYQAYLLVPLLMLEGLGLRLASTQYLLRQRAKYAVLEPLLSAVHIVAYVGLAIVFLGAWQAVAFIAVNHALTGLYLGSVFAPNHKGMVILRDAEMDFMRRQILTARNIEAHPVTDFLYGGQNFQIEHHLFPSMPRNRLRAAQTIVKAFCAERGIPYEETSLVGSYRQILGYLHRVSAPLRA
jgi:fatty acid desaturase